MIWTFYETIMYGSMIIFIVMPAVISTEAYIYNKLKEPVYHDLKTSYDQIEETVVKGGWG